MISLETLLGAAIGAMLSVMGEAGFGEKAKALFNSLKESNPQKERDKAFHQAFKKAAENLGTGEMGRLLKHEPFKEALITGLIDPVKGLDLQSAAPVLGEDLPSQADAIREFFSDLKKNLKNDKIWGPLLKEYDDLRFKKEVREVLQNKPTPEKIVSTIVTNNLQGLILAGTIEQVIQYFGEAPSKSDEEFYLKRVVTHCEILDMAAVEESSCVDGKMTSQIRVSDVFTNLYLKNIFRHPEESAAEVINRFRKPGKAGRKFPEEMMRGKGDRGVPVQALEAAGNLNRLVILGTPGGGKSTLVNHLAVQLAKRRKGDSDAKELPGFSGEEKPMPVRIILRQFAAWIQDGNVKVRDEGLVWDYLRHLLKEWGCEQFHSELRRRLDEEGGVVFFDGLDEVKETDATNKRSIIVKAVENFAKPLAKCRIIITCREYAYRWETAWRLDDAVFPVVELDRLQPEQIESFVHTWYRVTGHQKGWTINQIESEAGKLISAIRAYSHLNELAPNPLLLTLMAIVHGGKGLPEDRADLYERAVTLLLAHWENRIIRERDGSCRVEPSIILNLGLPVQALREPLEHLALTAHERQEKQTDRKEDCADISSEEVREELFKELKDWNLANEVMEYIRDRTGLLQAYETKVFKFPHRTFQEYLVASGVKRKSDFALFLRERIMRDRSWWQEVFLLTAGACRHTPPMIQNMLNALLPQGSRDLDLTRNVIQDACLAARAIHETDFVKQVRNDSPDGLYVTIHKRVQNWLLIAQEADRKLNQTQRSEAGTALNWVGDPRFDPDHWYLPLGEDFGFVKIPAGPFLMGSNNKIDQEADKNEFPQRRVELSEYRIGRYPVTVGQFLLFIEESGYEMEEDWHKYNRYDNHPVVDVSWEDAQAYCRWLGKKIGRRVGLPTEAQWEKACRGVDGWIYPWGNDPINLNKANYLEGDKWDMRKKSLLSTSPVGCFPSGMSVYGVFDMIGNVWEWCQDWFGPYPKKSIIDPTGPGDGSARVLRGGSWFDSAWDCRAAARIGRDPSGRGHDVGFRLVLLPGQPG